MKKQNNHWVGVADKNNDPKFKEVVNQEFVGLPIEETISNEELAEASVSNRRDFLKYLGFGLGAATVAASCDTPVRRAIPYVVKPDAIVPGVASYYASSFVNGGDYCAVLVKTREGRPIKIEGNTLSSITKGGTSARAQAYLLSLYDNERLKAPATIKDGVTTDMTWEALDRAVGAKLTAGSNIRIVTNTVLSPTTKKVFAAFTRKYPNTKVVTYDPISSAGILDANEASFGQAVVPNYHFDKADVIVSFGADFLGTWISPIEFSKAYTKNRVIDNVKNAKMSRHIQVESGMSLTGSNADNRILVRPSEMDAAIANLLNELGGNVSAPKINAKAAKAIKAAAKELKAARGKSLVVSNSNNSGAQVLVNKINDLLGNYGNTLDFGAVSMQRQGRDKDIRGLVAEMNSGGVDALFVWNANPVYDLPDADKFAAGMKKVATKVTFGLSLDETGKACNFAAPTHHALEAWGDVEAKRGHYSLIQPTIAPLFKTRQAEETLLKWTGNNTSYYDYLQANWKANMLSLQSQFLTFQSFWDNTLHDGVFEVSAPSAPASFAGNVSAAAAQIEKPSNAAIELAFYETVNIGAGQYANNPWLQEMPDPVMRTVWGNYLSVPIEWDGDSRFVGLNGTGSQTVYGISDILKVTGTKLDNEFSTVPQFGQAPNTVSIGMGYGRQTVGKAGKNVGVNVFPSLGVDANGNTKYHTTKVEISNIVGKNNEFGCVQYHHTLGVTGEQDGKQQNLDEIALSTLITDGYQGSLVDRTVLFQDNLKNVKGLAKTIEKKRTHAKHLNDETLYPYKEYMEENYGQGHHWAMHIDMNACTGCSACTVACMVENNVPVVGNREVSRHHEMTWLRIDRYYYGDAENPNVAYMPMMCQHCDNAPCENVCPVNATNHSSEGLNQMTYNRCVGTRYCANNCPYKVRRFNWLDYNSADLFGGNQNSINGEDPAYYTDNLVRMVLNPDVTVRSRGVIEKCSFCVQRLQEGKLKAKSEGRKLVDDDVKVACASACPTGAITFGDTNNPKGNLSTKIKSPLVYRALEETNVQSSVYYQARVNNRNEALDA